MTVNNDKRRLIVDPPSSEVNWRFHQSVPQRNETLVFALHGFPKSEAVLFVLRLKRTALTRLFFHIQITQSRYRG